MKIDLDNYEAYFLDFVEGRLDDSSTLEMLAFLRTHPELKEQLECFSDFRMEPLEISFAEKDVLKKFDFAEAPVSHHNFDDFCIAYYEKILTTSESEKLFSFLEQHPEKWTDFNQFGKVTLQPDMAVVYGSKSFLKRRIVTPTRTIILRWTAVAAGIVLAISVFYKSPVKREIPVSKSPAQIIAVAPPDKQQLVITPQVAQPVVSTKAKAIKYSASKISEKPLEETTEAPTVEPAREELALITPVGSARIGIDDFDDRPVILPSSSTAPKAVADDDETELLAYAEKVIKQKVLKGDDKPKKKVSFWDIAEMTVKGYNHISENEIILRRQTDENGKLTAVAVETETRVYGFESKN
jgi:hypothetical protein